MTIGDRPMIMNSPTQKLKPTTEPVGSLSKQIWQILNRKIWLPRTIYTALPFVYIGLGLYAMTSALFMTHWSWIVPYFMIIGVVCLHAGLLIATMRWRNSSLKSHSRQRRRQVSSKSVAGQSVQ